MTTANGIMDTDVANIRSIKSRIEWNPVAPPTGPLRVLVIDDDEDDFLIARDLLREVSRDAYKVEWAEDAEAAFARLAAAPPCDICLLDYRLRRVNGLELLSNIRAAGFDLPVILLTGQDDRLIDEEAVRRGASDYLVKGQIDSALLERSIRYALRQSRTEDALRRQGEFVSAILDTAGALVVVVDLQGRIVRFNRACEDLSGWRQTEVVGQNLVRLLIPQDQETYVENALNRLSQGESPVRAENDWQTRKGDRHRIAWANTILRDANGKPEYVVGTGIDVTDQRRAEAALADAREREISVGATIQRTLLFRKPPAHLPGVSVGAVARAAQRVGGDYADFFVYNDRCFDLLVGDVMGKGVAAALLSAAAKAQFQRAVRRLSLDLGPFQRLPEPDEIVTSVHATITRELIDMNSFVTLSYARLDRENQRLTLVDCGHPRPLHYCAATGKWTPLEGENIPLGINPKEIYRQTITSVAPGDVVFFYTDGITEAANDADDLFGEERLLDVLAQLSHSSPQEMVEGVCEAANRFRGTDGGEPDDMTAIAFRVESWNPTPRRAFQHLEVASDPDRLETLRRFVEDFARQFGGDAVSEEERDRLVLALNEAAANVIRHAYGGRRDARMRIEAEAYDDRLVWRLFDNGKPFQGLERVLPPSFDGSRDGGFGVYLMRATLDDIEYARNDMGHNTLTLTRRLAGDAPRGDVLVRGTHNP